jgi:hypothetical protein
MPTINQRMSLNMPEAEAQAVRDAVKLLQDKLAPHLIDLGVEERRALPKMGDKTVAFVSKALEYAREHPGLGPSFVDVDEFGRDLAAIELLMGLQRPLAQLMDMVEDSLLQAGSEAYSAALAYYHSAKAAARLNVAGAAVIADDLAKSFPSRGSIRATGPAKDLPDSHADGSAAAHQA